MSNETVRPMMSKLDIDFMEIHKLAEKMATDHRFIWDDPMTLIYRYAMMQRRNMSPIPHRLHLEKHFAWDHENNWPLGDGTSLNDVQYEAIERMLDNPQLARTCYCGKSIPYGGGVGSFFCSEKCRDNRGNPGKIVTKEDEIGAKIREVIREVNNLAARRLGVLTDCHVYTDTDGGFVTRWGDREVGHHSDTLQEVLEYLTGLRDAFCEVAIETSVFDEMISKDEAEYRAMDEQCA